MEAKKNQLSQRIIEQVNTKETLNKKKDELNRLEHDSKEAVWNNILKKYEKDYAEAFTGFRNNKDKFYAEVNRRYENLQDRDFDTSELSQRAKTLFGEKPSSCDCISLEIENELMKAKLIETDSIWTTAVVGSKDVPIGALIHKLHSNDWVNEGRKFIEGESDVCPFCQQHTITDDFRNQPENFFDDTYKNQVERISTFSDEYEIAINNITTLMTEMTANEESIKVGKLDKELLLSKIELFKQIIAQNKQKIREKKIKPEIKIEFEEYSNILNEIVEIQKQANEEINIHNRLVQDLQNSKKKLIDDVWSYVLNEQKQILIQSRKQMEGVKKAITGIKTKVDELQKIINCLNTEIEELGKNVTSVQPTVNEINRLLKAYGFNNFLIAPSKTQKDAYQIQREDGTLAFSTLSEGEETFIAFLYFMQMRKGALDQSKVSNKKVLILDDPICSLDSTILYIVSAMVKDLAVQVKSGESDVSQIFILTHNVFFHKEASFLDGRPNNENGEVNYWIISKDKNVSTIKAYGMTNPITTSYELLWKELRESNSNTSLITAQNIMRRIIENYFGMLGRGKEAFIEAKFDSPEDAMICKSLFYWINDGSHMITDDLFIDPYTDSIERYKEIFKQIFVKTGNETHYNMMMKVK